MENADRTNVVAIVAAILLTNLGASKAPSPNEIEIAVDSAIRIVNHARNNQRQPTGEMTP